MFRRNNKSRGILGWLPAIAVYTIIATSSYNPIKSEITKTKYGQSPKWKQSDRVMAVGLSAGWPVYWGSKVTEFLYDKDAGW